MVTRVSAKLRDEAACFFREVELPDSLDWVGKLSPLHQRLFAVELSDALKELALTGDDAKLASALEGWRATADLDAAPEVQAALRRPKTYRPLNV
jgi:hypothetical protein